VIEAAPVLVLPAADCPALDPEGTGRGALGLGLVTLCNHASLPTAKVERNFARHTLDLIAIRPIEPGDEVTIDYGCPLWFEPRD